MYQMHYRATVAQSAKDSEHCLHHPNLGWIFSSVVSLVHQVLSVENKKKKKKRIQFGSNDFDSIKNGWAGWDGCISALETKAIMQPYFVPFFHP